jgi:hypothetical protein
MGACATAGIVFGVANSRGAWLPARIGYVIAVVAWVGGLSFGLKAIWLPYAAIAAFGLTTFVADTISPPPGDDQRALVLVYVTVSPVLFMVPALIGAVTRRLLKRRPH